MAEIDLDIGGKTFRVACADGEERQLQSAAALVASEAQNLVAAIGQLPESRMLLMSSLMLGDRHIALQGQLRAAEDRIRALELRAERAEAESHINRHFEKFGEFKGQLQRRIIIPPFQIADGLKIYVHSFGKIFPR